MPLWIVCESGELKEQATLNEYLALKLIEVLCHEGKITVENFRDILHRYSNKIDCSEFSCYTDSKQSKTLLARDGVYNENQQ